VAKKAKQGEKRKELITEQTMTFMESSINVNGDFFSK
jgi:hypothetical protein